MKWRFVPISLLEVNAGSLLPRRLLAINIDAHELGRQQALRRNGAVDRHLVAIVDACWQANVKQGDRHRIGCIADLARHWAEQRNQRQTDIDWQFHAADACTKLKYLYPKTKE